MARKRKREKTATLLAMHTILEAEAKAKQGNTTLTSKSAGLSKHWKFVNEST